MGSPRPLGSLGSSTARAINRVKRVLRVECTRRRPYKPPNAAQRNPPQPRNPTLISSILIRACFRMGTCPALPVHLHLLNYAVYMAPFRLQPPFRSNRGEANTHSLLRPLPRGGHGGYLQSIPCISNRPPQRYKACRCQSPSSAPLPLHSTSASTRPDPTDRILRLRAPA